MKKLKLIGFLTLLASSFLLTNCTTETLMGAPGIAGIDGTDGTDGTNGVNGIDGTAECITCHNTSHKEAINASYIGSKHFSANTRTGSCAACHSHEGYLDLIKGKFDALNYPSGTAVSKRTCTTCHAAHSTFDFVNDGQDFALRSIDPVQLIYLPGVTIDFNSASNACVQCHQPRGPVPALDADGLNMTVTSSNRSATPHYGVNATFLAGVQGYKTAGDTTYPTTNPHNSTNASCTSCHMGTSTDALTGTHTFKPTLTACLSCHSDATSFDRNGLQTEVTTLKTTLQALMVSKGMMSGTSLITGKVLPKAYVEIYWNWKSVDSDHSEGIHNPGYIKALLKNSIQTLTALPAIT